MAKTSQEMFEKFLTNINKDVLTPEQFKQAFAKVMKWMKERDAENKQVLATVKELLETKTGEIKATNDTEFSTLRSAIESKLVQLAEREQELQQTIAARMAEVRDGLDADEDMVTERAAQRATENLSPVLTEQEARLATEMEKLGEQIAEAYERIEELLKEAKTVGPRISQAVGSIQVPSPVGWTKHQSISLSSGTTTYSLDEAPAHNGKAAIVRYEGQVLTDTTHYSFNGTDITLTFDPNNGTKLDVTYWPF